MLTEPVRQQGLDTNRRQSSFGSFITYVVAFHLVGAAWPFFIYPRLVALGDRTFTYAVLNISLRLLLWVAPVWMYLRHVDGVEPLEYLKLKQNVGRGLVMAAGLTVVNFVGTFARFGPPHPSMQSVTWNSILGTSFLVGFIEEIPYRGFMLQKFAERLGFWPANVVTSLLFLAVHLPGWTALHMLRADREISVFVIGFVLAIAFGYSGSLWASIVTHSTNDFMSAVLFRL